MSWPKVAYPLKCIEGKPNQQRWSQSSRDGPSGSPEACGIPSTFVYLCFFILFFFPKGLWVTSGRTSPPKRPRPFTQYGMRMQLLLTVGSFLLTVELFCLQLTILAFLLTDEAFLLTMLAFSLTIEACLFAVRNFRASNKHPKGLKAKKLNCKQQSFNCNRGFAKGVSRTVKRKRKKTNKKKKENGRRHRSGDGRKRRENGRERNKKKKRKKEENGRRHRSGDPFCKTPTVSIKQLPPKHFRAAAHSASSLSSVPLSKKQRKS